MNQAQLRNDENQENLVTHNELWLPHVHNSYINKI
jgi:hypothetical protein